MIICFRWGHEPNSLCLPPHHVVQTPIETGFSQWGHAGNWNLPYKPMFPLSEQEEAGSWEADSETCSPGTPSTECQ